MTARQEDLLVDLRRRGGAFLYGADVTVSRALARLGLVTIEDCGDFRPNGRSDGERWLVHPIGCWHPVLNAAWIVTS